MQTIVYECLMTYCASGLAACQRIGDLEKMTQGGLREMQNLLSQQGKFSQEQHAQFQKLKAEKRQQEERRKKQEEDEKRRLDCLLYTSDDADEV